MKGVIVKVPATSANLGPGFDCLGIALDLWNELEVTYSDNFSITAQGEGSDEISFDSNNLIVRSANRIFEFYNKPIPKLTFHCSNGIPLARGLGSSAAAVVSGLVAGWALANDSLDINLDLIYKLASDIDGHPDNVAPAIFGGICLSYTKSEKEFKHPGKFSLADLTYSKINIPNGGFRCVLFSSDKELKTSESRAILPEYFPIKDVVFNISRVALLVNSIASGKFEDLKYAMEDKIHQPYRSGNIKYLKGCIEKCLEHGAYCAYLSGSGPSIIAWCRYFSSISEDNESFEMKIGNSMAREASKFGVQGKIILTELNFSGVSCKEII